MIVKDFLSISSELKNIEIVAICNIRASKDAIIEFAKGYHIKQAYLNFEELIASDVDTIYIALPNHLHYSFAKRVLEAGKHVIADKPLCTKLLQPTIQKPFF